MKHIHVFAFSVVLSILGAHAGAESLSIACYGTDHSLSIYVDTGEPGMTASYIKPNYEVSFTSTPSSWGERYSFTNVVKSAQDIEVVTQVISGDVETPVFDSSLDLKLKWNPEGHYYVESVKLYRLSELVEILPFQPEDTCYVQ